MQVRRHGTRGREDVIDHRPLVARQRSRHGDHVYVGGLGGAACLQVTGMNALLHQPVEIGLGDVNAAVADGLHDRGVDVDAEHVVPAARNERGGRKADIAQADNADVLRLRTHGCVPP